MVVERCSKEEPPLILGENFANLSRSSVKSDGQTNSAGVERRALAEESVSFSKIKLTSGSDPVLRDGRY